MPKDLPEIAHQVAQQLEDEKTSAIRHELSRGKPVSKVAKELEVPEKRVKKVKRSL